MDDQQSKDVALRIIHSQWSKNARCNQLTILNWLMVKGSAVNRQSPKITGQDFDPRTVPRSHFQFLGNVAWGKFRPTVAVMTL